MRTRAVEWIFICMLSGCAHQTAEGRAISVVSADVMQALEESAHLVYDVPVALLTRLNACKCDEKLMYEVQIAGHWRHVMVRGDEAALNRLSQAARSVPQGTPFEFLYVISDDIYMGQQGQKFYSVDVSL